MSQPSELNLRDETTQIAGTMLDLGFRRTARELFRHTPPTPLELEEAIAAVEDEIARAKPPRGVQLVTRDAIVREIALAAGVPPGPAMALARDAVEHAFECAIRRPPDNERLAALLILRELMHHLDVTSVELLP